MRRERAEGRRAGAGAAVASAFAARTRSASWTVDLQHGMRVLDGQHVVYTLKSNNVRDAAGNLLCTVQRPAGATELLESGLGDLVVRGYPTAPLIALMGPTSAGPVLADLLAEPRNSA